jgi:hypothetical protein
MVSKVRRQRRSLGGISGLPLEAEVVVVDPDGGDAIALWSPVNLRLVYWPRAIHLFVVLSRCGVDRIRLLHEAYR